MASTASATIRAAEPADAGAIAAVHVAAWRWAYRGHLPDEHLDALDVAEREAGWLDVLQRDQGRVLVAEGGAGMVGFVSVGPSRDADAPDGMGELFAIYVLEAAAGRGLGGRLLSEAVAALCDAGFSRASLWVLESNTQARRFYERHGWVWDGTRSDHQVACANLPIVRYVRPF